MKKFLFLVCLIFSSLHILFAQEQEERPKVYSLVNDLRVRKTPDMKGEVIAKLAYKDSAYYLNISENTATATLRGKEITSSWVEIEMMNGQKGWAFGGAVVNWYVFPTIPKDAKSKANITVNDEGYVIKTANGGVKTLTNEYPTGIEYNENTKVFQFSKYYPNLKCYGFEVFYPEFTGYILVNEENGEISEISGEPSLSPSKKGIVCLSHVPEADVITYYKLEGTKITQVWEEELINGARVLDKVEWVSEKEIKLTGKDFSSDIPATISVIFDMNTKKVKF